MHRILICLGVAAAFAACQTTDDFLYQRVMNKQADVAGFTQKKVKLADHTIPYLENGGTGDAIVFLHGFGADKDRWVTPFITAFEKQRVLIPDIPGFGDATFDRTLGYTTDKQVRRLFAFMDAVGVNQAHLVGNSMGGALALAMAAKAPERVLTLSLLDPAGVPGAPRSEYGQSLDRGEPNRLIVEDEESLQAMLDLVFVVQPKIPDNARPLLIRRYQRLKAQHDFIFDEFGAQKENAASIIAQVQTPTTIIWGDSDRVLSPEGGAILQKMLPGSELHIIEDCGHAPQYERPLESSNIVLDWIEAHPASAP